MSTKKTAATSPEKPRQAEHKLALARFLQNPENRAALKTIVNHPVFIAAMNHLEEESRKAIATQQPVPAEMIARQAAFHQGVGSVYDRLTDLCHLREVPQQDEAWDHLQPQTP